MGTWRLRLRCFSIQPLAFSLLLCFAGSAHAIDLITATISITNNPSTNSHTLTINGNTRTWTNDVSASPGTLILATNTPSNAATQLVAHLNAWPVNAAHYLSQTAETNVLIQGFPGEALAVSSAGGWSTVTMSTQALAPVIVVRVPYTYATAAQRTNIASGIVEWLTFATNAIPTNAAAAGNYLQKGAGPLQTVTAPVQFSSLSGTSTGLTNGSLVYAYIVGASNISGRVAALTNGYWTNAILSYPMMTNGANYGMSFRSPGSGTFSEQFGSNAQATATLALAVGYRALASGDQSIAIGADALAGYLDVVLGAGSEGFGAANLILGNSSAGNDTNQVIIGNFSTAGAGHPNVVLLGNSVTSARSNEVRLGSSTYTVAIPGILQVEGAQTNSLFRGTNTWSGDLALTRRANSSPVNGDNAGVVLGTNVLISITGPTTLAAYCGFASERGDSFHIVRFAGAVTNLLRNESGIEPTAGNRIVTGTGADLSLTNQPSWAELIYNAAASRWEVTRHSR